MNVYHEIANNYFRQMEGWYLYRKQARGLLWIWAVVGVIWFASLIPLGKAIFNADWLMYCLWLACVVALEGVLLTIGARVQKRKHAALMEAINTKYAVATKCEQECRLLLLTKLLERSPERFFSTAKEISDLLKLRQEFRARNESEPGFFWRAIYDRESKPRLLAVTLAAITVFTALTIRSLPEGPSIFELVADRRLLAALGALVMTSAAFFLVLIGARAIAGVVWHAVTIWVAKTVATKQSVTALNYLVRDLIFHHKPVDATQAEIPQPAVPSALDAEVYDPAVLRPARALVHHSTPTTKFRDQAFINEVVEPKDSF